jgi:hypothetical protein
MTDQPTNSPAPTPASETPNQLTANPSESGEKVDQSTHSEPAESKPEEYFDVKVNGRNIKMTRQEVIDHASMSHAANDKFNEAKRTRQEVDKILSRAKSNPLEALMDPALGLTRDQLRDAVEKWYSKEFIEPEALSPEERKMKEYEERIKGYETQEKEKKEQAEREAEEKMTSHQREFLQGQIIEALEKSNLPKTKETVRKMAFYMRQNLVNGWDAPMEMIIRQVKNERQNSVRDEVSNSNAEQLIDLFGEELINKIRQHDLKQLRDRRNLPPVDTDRGPRGGGTGPMPGERLSSRDVNNRLKEMRLGKI